MRTHLQNSQNGIQKKKDDTSAEHARLFLGLHEKGIENIRIAACCWFIGHLRADETTSQNKDSSRSFNHFLSPKMINVIRASFSPKRVTVFLDFVTYLKLENGEKEPNATSLWYVCGRRSLLPTEVVKSLTLWVWQQVFCLPSICWVGQVYKSTVNWHILEIYLLFGEGCYLKEALRHCWSS